MPSACCDGAAERGKDVLDRVVLVDVEIAAGDAVEVESGVEGKQREQVVEEADPGRDVRPTAAVERQRDPERRLGARADQRCLAPGQWARLGAERSQKDVVLGRPPERDPDPLREAAHDDALLLEPRAEIVLAADPDEVARNRRCIEPGRDKGVADALSLGELPREVVARVAERGGRDAGSRRRDRRRCSAGLEHSGRCRSCDRIPDPERGVAEGLRHRSQHDRGWGTRRARE